MGDSLIDIIHLVYCHRLFLSRCCLSDGICQRLRLEHPWICLEGVHILYVYGNVFGGDLCNARKETLVLKIWYENDERVFTAYAHCFPCTWYVGSAIKDEWYGYVFLIIGVPLLCMPLFSKKVDCLMKKCC